MQNKAGTTIPVFLTQKINALDDLQQEIAQQLSQAAPAYLEQPDFIRTLTTVREVLPRCNRLRDAVAMAILEKKSLVDTLQAAIANIDNYVDGLRAANQVYRCGLPDPKAALLVGLGGLANEALAAFRLELLEFLPQSAAALAEGEAFP